MQVRIAAALRRLDILFMMISDGGYEGILTILDTNQLVYKTLISQLGKKRRNHIDPPIQDYQGIKFVRGNGGIAVGRKENRFLV